MTITREYLSPFRHWVIDGLLPVAAELATAEAAASLARHDAHWLPYDNCLQRKWLVDDPAAVGPDTAHLLALLAGPYQLAQVQQLLGGPVPGLTTDPTGHGGSVHALLAGDFLGPHLDRALHPRLEPPVELRAVLVMFLIKRWHEGWGGELELYDDSGPELKVGASVTPAPGRAVVWECTETAYHGVRRVSDDCPVPRVSATCFYYAPARPGAVRKRALFVSPRG